MSSHHIIREKQEPALIVEDLSHFDPEYLGQLLEWSPTVIANTQSAAQLEALQIKVDLVLSIEGLQLFLEAALDYLIQGGYPSVNIISSQNQVNHLYPYLPAITIVLYWKNKKIFAVKSGFSKWKLANEYLDIFPEQAITNSTGLVSVGRQRFKTSHDGFFQLYFDANFLFIVEDL